MRWLHNIYDAIDRNSTAVAAAQALRRQELSRITSAFNRKWRCRLPNAQAHVGFCLQNALRPWARAAPWPVRPAFAALPATVERVADVRGSSSRNTGDRVSSRGAGAGTPPQPAVVYSIACYASTPTHAERARPPIATPRPEAPGSQWPAARCGNTSRLVLVLVHDHFSADATQHRAEVEQQAGLLLRTLVSALRACPTHVAFVVPGDARSSSVAAHMVRVVQTLAPHLTAPWLRMTVEAVPGAMHGRHRQHTQLAAAQRLLSAARSQASDTPTLLIPLDTVFQRDPFDLVDARFLLQLTVTAPEADKEKRQETNLCGMRPWRRGTQIVPSFAMGPAHVLERHVERGVGFALSFSHCALGDALQPLLWGQVENGVVQEYPTWIGGYATTPHVTLREETHIRADALVRQPDATANDNGSPRCAVASTAGPAALVMDYWRALRPSEGGTVLLPVGPLDPPLPADFVPTAI